MKCQECNTSLTVWQIIGMSIVGHADCKCCSARLVLINRRFIRMLLVLLLAIFVLLNYYFVSKAYYLGFYGIMAAFAALAPTAILVLLYGIFVVPAMDVKALI